MNAVEIVRSADAFQRDGHRDLMVDRLLKGSVREQNAERAVEGICPSGTCPTMRLAESCVSEVITPLDMFTWLYDTNRDKFMLRMGAEEGGVAWWWSAMRNTDEGRAFWAKHPIPRRSHTRATEPPPADCAARRCRAHFQKLERVRAELDVNSELWEGDRDEVCYLHQHQIGQQRGIG